MDHRPRQDADPGNLLAALAAHIQKQPGEQVNPVKLLLSRYLASARGAYTSAKFFFVMDGKHAWKGGL